MNATPYGGAADDKSRMVNQLFIASMPAGFRVDDNEFNTLKDESDDLGRASVPRPGKQRPNVFQ